MTLRLWAAISFAGVIGFGGIAGCVAPPPVSPQSTVEPRGAPLSDDAPLTVDVAVRHALANDPAVRAARHGVSAAYWQKVQASLPANPRSIASADPTEWVVKLSALLADLVDLVLDESAASQDRTADRDNRHLVSSTFLP